MSVLLRFAREAFKDNVELDLRNTKLADFNESLQLFKAGKLKRTLGLVSTSEDGGSGLSRSGWVSFIM